MGCKVWLDPGDVDVVQGRREAKTDCGGGQDEGDGEWADVPRGQLGAGGPKRDVPS